MATYLGSCHCGRFTLGFSTDWDPDSLLPRTGQCGFCRRHGSMAISDPDGRLTVRVQADGPAPYRFASMTTDFHICDRCGVWVAATWQDGNHLYGVVNLLALAERARFCGPPSVANLDGEDIAGRDTRRRLGWTPARVVGPDEDGARHRKNNLSAWR
jgi:hypothetical protein